MHIIHKKYIKYSYDSSIHHQHMQILKTTTKKEKKLFIQADENSQFLYIRTTIQTLNIERLFVTLKGLKKIRGK